jgi:hypothetical protein
MSRRLPEITWEPRIETVQTRSELELIRLLAGPSAVRIALVVLIHPDSFDGGTWHSNIDYPVRRFIEAGRGDALIPILVAGRKPTLRDQSRGRRLVAAAPVADWRRTWRDSDFDALSEQLERALAVPLVPSSAGPESQTRLKAVVRVAASGGGDCFRINEGLALARSGGRVEVEPGDYLEDVRIRRSVQLVGVGPRESIRVTGGWAALSTSYAPARPVTGLRPTQRLLEATVENMTFRAAKGASHPVVSLHAGNVAVRDCSIESHGTGDGITDNGYGGEHFKAGSARFLRCVIEAGGAFAAQVTGDNHFTFADCVFLGRSGQTGLALYNTGSAEVRRCIFAGLDWPILAQSTGTVAVRSCLIWGGLLALHAGCSVQADVSNVRIVESRWGALAQDDAQLTMYGCRFERCIEGGLMARGQSRAATWANSVRASAGPGIWIQGNAECVAANWRIQGARWGAVASDESLLEIIGSTIRDSQAYGIGASGRARLRASGNKLRSHPNGIQFTEHSQGEVEDNFLSAINEHGVGVWSDGHVAMVGNLSDMHGGPRLFVAPRPDVQRDSGNLQAT